jgi:phosphocarrier protein HPr
VVPNRRGLHARAVARLVTVAEHFAADIRIIRGDNEAGSRSMMGLINLGAGVGTQLQVHGEGWDAAEGVAAIVELIECGFGEID